jgi:hypothetical protein
MPYRLTISDQRVQVDFSGVFSREDLLALARDTAELEATPHGALNRLADLSGVTSASISYVDMHSLVQSRKESPPRSPVRTAIVAPSDVTYGFARMFQTLNDQPNLTIEIFRTLEDAETWLRGRTG